jgi:hypothetical protein
MSQDGIGWEGTFALIRQVALLQSGIDQWGKYFEALDMRDSFSMFARLVEITLFNEGVRANFSE